MAHAIPNPSHPRLDGGRIAAEVGTIAVNVGLLLVLLVPLSAPLHVDIPEPETTTDWLPRVKPKPVPPIVVPVVKPPPRAVRSAAVVQPPRVEPQPLPQVLDPAGEIAVPPFEEVVVDRGGDSIAPNVEPLAGAQLQYASAPAPGYPMAALREGLAGTVVLQVLVDVDGRPLQVAVSRSSGHRVLDQAARKQVLARWRFVPAMRNGAPVQAIGLVPVEFALRR
ncbi:energy transducer TonB [Lysobacter koreensis]|uniref:Energy transducer TonB n=1 Tax=Lysobacter koreensis TaxID=266122 RepID=A0ABW2YMF8_9GAMM